MSYENAALDLETLTGIKLSRSTQQRLVHRQEITEVSVCQDVEELSIDGGKIRLRTPVGQECIWKDYKAVNLHTQAVAAFFQDNQALLAWVNRQPLPEIFTCIQYGSVKSQSRVNWSFAL